MRKLKLERVDFLLLGDEYEGVYSVADLRKLILIITSYIVSRYNSLSKIT